MILLEDPFGWWKNSLSFMTVIELIPNVSCFLGVKADNDISQAEPKPVAR